MESVMRMMKRRILHAIIMMIGVIMVGTANPGIYVQAADKGVSVIEQAKKNVFRIEVSLTCDGKAEPKLIRSGTCFVVGNAEKDQQQYLITAKTNLDVSKKNIKKYRKTNKLEDNDNVQTVYEIIISDDIRRSATIYDKAQDSNYAILNIGETIQGCSGLAIGSLEQTKENVALFLLTYDDEKCQVNLESTHLEQTDENSIYYQAVAKEGFGAPIVDESGFLLGMRIPPAADDATLAEGLRVDTLQHAFDILGLGYENSDSKITVLEEKIKKAQEAVDSGDYTKKTCTVVQSALDEAQMVYDDVRSTDTVYVAQVEKLEKAMEQLKPMKEIYRLVMFVLGGVLLVILLIVIIVCIRIRKRKKALNYREDGSANVKRRQKGIMKRKKAENKKNFEIDYDATVAVSTKIPTAYLVHKNSGERVLIAKSYFALGSKAEGSDYQITGNPAVSRKHAAIVNENGVFFLQDLESMNHSYVNDHQLPSGEKSVLRDRDVIRLANEEFVFELR